MKTGREGLPFKKSLSDASVPAIQQRASSRRVGNQGSVLGKSQFHSFTQYEFTKCLQSIRFHLQPSLGQKETGHLERVQQAPPSLQLKGPFFLELGFFCTSERVTS